MGEYENENVVFKREFTEGIYKEVIAFANTDGGVIYVGVDDEGNEIGLENIEDQFTRITNGISDVIEPDVTMFIKYKLEDNKIISINVSEGTNKPYYLKSKGLKSSGVFVRQGASSVPTSSEQIKQMIKQTDGDEFELMRSMEQDLSFNYAKRVFENENVEFSNKKYRLLGLTKQDGLYTNLALLLSDQCPTSVKIGVFSNENMTVFKDSVEIKGSIFEQVDESYKYLKLCNNTSSIIEGLKRINLSDYPNETIREALLNSLIHRDYSFSGSIIINVTDRKMEFISLGGLFGGITLKDIQMGISQPRNKRLAEVFHRLNFIESYGTGIRRIYELYADNATKPWLEVSPNVFKITLPNKNIGSKEEKEGTVTNQMQQVIDYIKSNGRITEEEISKLLSIKKTRTYLLTRQMIENGLIKIEGKGKDKVYKLL